jgi:catechol 2,3-dioxygenase-like lactoylglutathione lyase family enzyme
MPEVAMAKSKPRPAARSTRKTKAKARPRRAAQPRRKRRKDPEALRLRGFTPSFTVNDLGRSLAFYTEALCFVVGERWEHEGRLQGVMLKAGACELGLSQDDWKKGRDRRKGEAVRISCATVQDVDALAARVKAAGYRLAEDPHDPEWGGGRAFSVDDPDGFHLTIYRA